MTTSRTGHWPRGGLSATETVREKSPRLTVPEPLPTVGRRRAGTPSKGTAQQLVGGEMQGNTVGVRGPCAGAGRQPSATHRPPLGHCWMGAPGLARPIQTTVVPVLVDLTLGDQIVTKHTSPEPRVPRNTVNCKHMEQCNCMIFRAGWNSSGGGLGSHVTKRPPVVLGGVR